MCSYVLMKVLESSEKRYDSGMRILTLGNEMRAKRYMASTISAGERVLDLGVGTGTLALLCAETGAEVLGIDMSPAMIRVAEEKIRKAGFSGRVELRLMGVAEMDGLPRDSFDVVVATFLFTELSEDERFYALREAHRILRKSGRIMILDETTPSRVLSRFLYLLIRIPLAAATLLLAQTRTTPLRGIEGKLSEAGFRIESETTYFFDSLKLVIASKEEGG